MNQGAPPPEGFSVRVARFLAEDDPTDRSPEGLRGRLQGTRRFPFFSYSSLAYLAIEIVAGEAGSTVDFIERTKDDDRFVRVWPPQFKVIDYAPATILNKADLVAMKAQLTDISGSTRTFRHVWGPAMET
jgi:hypothetical protein